MFGKVKAVHSFTVLNTLVYIQAVTYGVNSTGEEIGIVWLWNDSFAKRKDWIGTSVFLCNTSSKSLPPCSIRIQPILPLWYITASSVSLCLCLCLQQCPSKMDECVWWCVFVFGLLRVCRGGKKTELKVESSAEIFQLAMIYFGFGVIWFSNLSISSSKRSVKFISSIYPSATDGDFPT